VLLIDHHPKRKSETHDPVADIYGTTAKGAVIDTALGLYRDRGDPSKAELLVTGRDIENRELLLCFDADTCTWHSLGDADDVREGTFTYDVFTTIKALWRQGKYATNAALVELLESDKAQVSRATTELIGRGKIVRGESVKVDGTNIRPFVPPERE